MPNVELVAVILTAIVPIVALARRIDVAYPIPLILGGIAIGYVPGAPRIELAPDVVLVLFLPGLVYWQSVTAPAQEFRANVRQIVSLAIALVVCTTLAVAAALHALVPGLGWAAAIVVGAIVAPTDEIAIAPILERLGVPRHTMAIIQGESLTNDAVSLVIYAVALSAVGAARHDLLAVGGQFIWSAVGAVLVGLFAGRIVTVAWSRIKFPELQVLISLLTPYLAYFPANGLHVSGILAVVTAGLVVARRTPAIIVPQARLFAIGFWETISFVANASIFLLIGLELHPNLERLAGESWQRIGLAALAVNTTIIIVRFAWVYGENYIPLVRITTHAHDGSHAAHLAVIAWAGIRGGVSLAAALALPPQFPHRDLFIFLTLSVILVSLVLQGATLPWLVRVLGIEDDGAERRDVRHASLIAARAALSRLDELEREGAELGIIGELRRRYERKARRFGSRAGDTGDDERFARTFAAIHTDVLECERQAVIGLNKRGEVDNQALRHVQNDFDLELVRLAGVSGLIVSDGEE